MTLAPTSISDSFIYLRIIHIQAIMDIFFSPLKKVIFDWHIIIICNYWVQCDAAIQVYIVQ